VYFFSGSAGVAGALAAIAAPHSVQNLEPSGSLAPQLVQNAI
jgi:hypothetical protein